MKKDILVAYASTNGATAEIATKIGSMLKNQDLVVDVLPVSAKPDPKQYKAAILGCAVYAGSWPKGSVEFLKANESAFAGQPFWLFSTGPTGEGDPVELLEGWRVPSNAMEIVERIHPRDVTIFGGFIDATKVRGIQAFVIKKMNKPFGDFRNWDAIAAWAQEIASSVKNQASLAGAADD